MPSNLTISAGRALILMIIAVTAIHPRQARGDVQVDEIYPPRVALFSEAQQSPPLIALSAESISILFRTFDRLGRFLPEESNRINWALDTIKSVGMTVMEKHEAAARLLQADILVSISFTPGARTSSADIRIKALNPEYRSMEKSFRVRSRIIQNLPLMLSREVAAVHRGVPVNAKIINYRHDEKTGGGFAVINAGEWSGLAPGRLTSSLGPVEVVELGRYYSLVKMGEPASAGQQLKFGRYPDIGAAIGGINDRIVKNTIKAYGLSSTLLKNQDDEGRFVASACVINPGGNVCLGGYGAYLSTSYLGFQDPTPATGGIIASTSAYLLQLTLPEMMTRFRTNFFPWIQDGDKTNRMKDLHIFLWSTIPLTFSAGFFDQLAYQFHQSEHLPPFFLYRDNMAALLSLAVPGGGLFYKGYRLAGWAYYFSEMSLAGYGVYNRDRGNRGLYALGAVGVLKALEIIHAYLIPPAYRFFNSELDNDSGNLSLSMRPGAPGCGETVVDLSLTRAF